jgi:hypothetical protein
VRECWIDLEAAMSIPVHENGRGSLGGKVADWWRGLSFRRWTAAERNCCVPDGGLERMTLVGRAHDREGVRGLVRCWHHLRFDAKRRSEPDCCRSQEVNPLAHDAETSRPDLRVIAGKWPNASAILLVERGNPVPTKSV